MKQDPDPIHPGEWGTVQECEYHILDGSVFWQVLVEWDSGRVLFLCIPPDVAKKV
jgi:hypothetical protein